MESHLFQCVCAYVCKSIRQANVRSDSETLSLIRKVNKEKSIQPKEQKKEKENETKKKTNKLNGKMVIFNNSNTVCVIFFIKNPSFVFIQNTLRLRIRSKLDLKLLVE